MRLEAGYHVRAGKRAGHGRREDITINWNFDNRDIRRIFEVFEMRVRLSKWPSSGVKAKFGSAGWQSAT